MNREEREKILSFIKVFIKNDKYKAIGYCNSWNGTCGRYFKGKEGADYVIETLTALLDGKKCFTENYQVFKGSVYYHLRKQMLTYFHLKENEPNEGKNSEISFTNAESKDLLNEENYYGGAEEIYKRVEITEVREEIFNCFDRKKDTVEIKFLEEVFKGGKRRAIAAKLGITPDEYTNISKRIKVRLIKSKIAKKIYGD